MAYIVHLEKCLIATPRIIVYLKRDAKKLDNT